MPRLRLPRLAWYDLECRVGVKSFKTLVRYGISSAPVFNSESQSYVGMLDYRDIADYVLIVFKKKQLGTIEEGKVWSITDIIEKAATGESVPAQAVSGKTIK